jgi:enoyl-[acyl-carrier protein] reductase/trans-2-enoyl-CoA reductase (NAD+)
MLIQPKIRGFICTTAHPEGCAAHVQQQIDFVKSQPPLPNPPKNVLVIGASTGYGLASRIVPAFGGGARTIGVFFEKPGVDKKSGSAGWYNSVAFEAAAATETRGPPSATAAMQRGFATRPDFRPTTLHN